jgi:ribosomal protein L37AE/L43A
VTDTKYDPRPEDKANQPMVKARPEDTIFQAPYTAPPAKPDGDEKPAKKPRDEMTPAEKAADTRARNARREKREERKAEREASAAAEAGHPASDESAESAFRRTWSCPHCGRGTTLGPDQQPPTIMRCDGCGKDVAGDTWLPPGVGHGEPTLPMGHER